jgi:hypothetical protein
METYTAISELGIKSNKTEGLFHKAEEQMEAMMKQLVLEPVSMFVTFSIQPFKCQVHAMAVVMVS